MNFKTVQRVAFLYEELKRIDAEIIQVDKLALYISSNPATVNLRMTAQKPKEEKVGFDEDGSLEALYNNTKRLYDMYMGFGLVGISSKYKDKEKPDFELDYVISDSVCLGVLGVLLSEKHRLRQVITDELRSIFV